MLSIRSSAWAASATFWICVTFEVTMASPRRIAPSTTATSTMSSWPDFPASPPTCLAMSSGGERGRLRDGQGGHGGGDRVLRSLLDRAGVAVDGRGDAVDLVQLGLDPGGAGGAGHPADDELELSRLGSASHHAGNGTARRGG